MKTLNVKIVVNNPTMEIQLTSEQYADFKKLSRSKQENIVMTKGIIKFSSIEINEKSSIKIQHYDC